MLLRWLLTPLHLLERARGWRRRLLVVAYLIVGTLIGLLTWRATSLRNLPDVGDPFDVAAFLKAGEIPADRDAFTLYREAAAGLKPNALRPDDALWKAATGGWASATPEVRGIIEENRRPLELWRRGTERTESVAETLPRLRLDEGFAPSGPMAAMGRLALVEGSRLESEGDLAGAWGWYRGVLRSCNHMRAQSRFRWRCYVANPLEAMAQGRIIVLATNPKADAPLLRRMLDEVLAIDAASPPVSGNYKAEYLAFVHALDDPMKLLRGADHTMRDAIENPNLKTWYHFYFFIQREPERSLRVSRLYFANHLAQCDRPASRRPTWMGNAPSGPIWAYYGDDPSAPDAANALAPKAFFDWLAATSIARRYLIADQIYAVDASQERRARAPLIVTLADQLYVRDHGQYPPDDSALVGRYLKRLPEGIDAMMPADLRHK